jgi:hypothetical protein
LSRTARRDPETADLPDLIAAEAGASFDDGVGGVYAPIRM